MTGKQNLILFLGLTLIFVQFYFSGALSFAWGQIIHGSASTTADVVNQSSLIPTGLTGNKSAPPPKTGGRATLA